MSFFKVGDRVELTQTSLWASTPLNIYGDETPIKAGSVGVVVKTPKNNKGLYLVVWESPWFPSSEKVNYGFLPKTRKLKVVGSISDSIEFLRGEIIAETNKETSALGVSHSDIVGLHYIEGCAKILRQFADLQAQIAKTFD